jgi:hypothetical protein
MSRQVFWLVLSAAAFPALKGQWRQRRRSAGPKAGLGLTAMGSLLF